MSGHVKSERTDKSRINTFDSRLRRRKRLLPAAHHTAKNHKNGKKVADAVAIYICYDTATFYTAEKRFEWWYVSLCVWNYLRTWDLGQITQLFTFVCPLPVFELCLRFTCLSMSPDQTCPHLRFHDINTCTRSLESSDRRMMRGVNACWKTTMMPVVDLHCDGFVSVLTRTMEMHVEACCFMQVQLFSVIDMFSLFESVKQKVASHP